jgi:hypothetical protein
MNIVLRLIVPSLLALAVAGCAAPGARDAITELTSFTPLAAMPQVRYAGGAHDYAARVAAVLPHAVATVEAQHYRRFRRAPEVFVCDTQACFDRVVHRRYNFSAAVVYDNRLVLSPQLFESAAARLAPVLIHELSHLHMGQVLGHYSMAIPVWFHEGFASLVAAGGGADLVTDTQTWQAIDAGERFLPDEQHLAWTRTMASAWKLRVSVFYRQAYLYLRDLRARDGAAFRDFIERLYGGEAFDEAFAQALQANPQRSALAFFLRLQCAEAPRNEGYCAHVPHAD